MGKKRNKGLSTTPPPVAPATAAISEGTPEAAVVTVQATSIAEVTPPPEPVAAVVLPVVEAQVAAPPPPAPVFTPSPAIVLPSEDLVTATPAPIEAAATTDAPPESESAESESFESEAPPSVAATSASPPAVKKKRRKKRVTKKPPAVAAPRDTLDQKIDRLEAKLEEKKVEAAKAAQAGFGKAAEEEDTSVPPVDLEVHDEFFSAGERGPQTKDASGSFAGLPARHAQKLSPEARARRAHLSRYVMWAVGGSAAILALGLTFSRLRGPHNEEPVRHEVVHAALASGPQPSAQQASSAAVPAPTASTIELADQGNLDDPNAQAGGDKSKTDDEVADDDKKKPDEMPAEKPKNAWQEKQAAKAALERGSNGVAVQAGERSVALDPSDGEAWLVLGGAYQAMGNNGQAKRCYNACVSQGKKGPISDCKDMLSSL